MQRRPDMVVHGAKGYVGGGVLAEGRYEVVVVDAGPSPRAVAAELQALVGISLTDPYALEDACPLVLYRELEQSRAEAVSSRLRRAGAEVELRNPRRRKVGLGDRPGPQARRAA